MSKTETALVKYVFLDIVAFTKGRSVEAQSDIVGELNKIVKSVLKERSIDSGNLILLPTGDGMCIALLDVKPFDIHLQVALDIIAEIDKYNDQTEDKMRKFEVRIAINQNDDNIIIDINDRKNVAGTGINMAQRIMSLADGNQILIGHAVYESLSGREKYMYSLSRYDGKDKHGNQFPVYQYVDKNCGGLNIDAPSLLKFKPRTVQEEKLSKLVAYYLIHAILNKDFLLSLREEDGYNSLKISLLYLKASDSFTESKASQFGKKFLVKQLAEGILEEQFVHYKEVDSLIVLEFALLIINSILDPFRQCFEETNLQHQWLFVSTNGIERLKTETPDVWEQFFPTDKQH